MKITTFFVAAGFLAATTVLSPAAHATEGRITFTGAIVEATCGQPLAGATSGMPDTAGHRAACVAAPGAAARWYTAHTARLDASVHDRVLLYFDTYVRTQHPGADDPLLVTKTYD